VKSEKLAPWIPTPLPIVYEILDLAGVTPCDTLYDLGSGDGRVVIIAARDFCLEKAIGIEIDPVLVELARAKARLEGVDSRAVFIEGDFLEVDIKDASIVYAYLYKSIIEKLMYKFEGELKPGTRIVTLDFPVPEWIPVLIRRRRDPLDIPHTLYLYIVGLSNYKQLSFYETVNTDILVNLKKWLRCPVKCDSRADHIHRHRSHSGS